MTFYFADPNPYLFKEIMKYAIKNNLFENLIEDFYKNLQLNTEVEQRKVPYICHPNTHWLVKELVIFETTLDSSEFEFSKMIAKILSKDFTLHLKERSSFILLAFLEN